MGLNVSQIASNMGIISRSQRDAENEVMRQRQLELQTQELNAQQRMRAELAQSAQNLANTPLMQFAQAPGSAYGTPEAPASAAPAAAAPAAPTPTAGLRTAPAAPAAPAARVAPAAPAAPAAAAPSAGLRTPQQLASVPTDQLSVAEFQALPPQDRLRRLQTENDRRQLNRIDVAGAKPPAAAFDIAALPITGAATLLEKGLNAVDFARFGRAAGFYDQDVTSVTVPGAGSLTPFYDRLRKAEGENQPLTEAQLLERLKTGETTRAKAAEAVNAKTQQYDAARTGYDDLMAKAAQANGIDPVVFKRLIGTESSFRPDAVSPRGEKYGLGIAQIAAVHGLPRNDMLNPDKAIPFAAQLLSKYLKEANGNYAEAIMKYKGATSEKGRASMQGAVDAILNNAPQQAPKKDVTAAAQTGTAKDVAEAVVESLKPASGGTMYGAATLDPSMRNPVIQQTLAVRKALQDQVAIYNRYGRGDLAMAEAAKIQAIDLGLYKGQADIGLYEGATTGNFSRAMSVLSAFTGAPHQVLQRPDGKGFDLYINGKVAKAGLKGDQVEMLVRTQVDAEYRKQLAAVQAERGKMDYEAGLEIKKKSAEITLQTAKEIQKAVIDGQFKLAEKQLEQAGFKLLGNAGGEGGFAYANGRGDIFIIDPASKKVMINGTEVTTGPQAQRVSGVDRSIWSSVNAPNATSQ